MTTDQPHDISAELEGSNLSLRRLDRLRPVVRVEPGDDDGSGSATATVDLDRLLRVMAVYRSVARYRYDWRWIDGAPDIEVDPTTDIDELPR